MTPNLRLLLAATVVSGTLHTVAAGADPKWTVAGALEGSARYNSNLTLLSADGPVEPKSAFLTEFNGRLSASRTLGAWRGDSQVNGLANVHASHSRENWFFSRSAPLIYVRLDANLSVKLRYLYRGNRSSVDLWNTATTSFRWALSSAAADGPPEAARFSAALKFCRSFSAGPARDTAFPSANPVTGAGTQIA